MFIDDHIKEQVRHSANIVEVVGADIELRRQGRDFAGRCPFHDDSNPSLRVNTERQTWKCWVCDVGGDVFSWVMRREGLSFPEALTSLAEQFGVQLPKTNAPRTERGAANDKPTLFAAAEWAEKQFHECLLRADFAAPAREYLAQRGINAESIERYRIGFAPNSYEWLIKRARAAGISPAVLDAVNLASAGRHGPIDFFRNRVMFPIHDNRQRPIAFGGRIMPGAASDKEQPKYINSKETRLFVKSQTLYGLNLCQKRIRESKRLIVMEGYTDVVMARQHGVEEVVAALGTAVGQQHVRLMGRSNAETVYLVLDGDAAGQRRTNEVLEVFVSSEVDLRIVKLPDGFDPCDFLSQYGNTQFEHLLERAVDALQYKIDESTRGIDLQRDTHRSNRALEEILRLVSSAPRAAAAQSEGLRLREQQILTKLARSFRVDEIEIRNRVDQLRTKKLSRSSLRTDRPATAVVPKPQVLVDPLERELLELLVRFPELIAQTDIIDPAWLRSQHSQHLLGIFRLQRQQGFTLSYDAVLNSIKDETLKSYFVGLDMDGAEKEATALENPDERMSGVCRSLQSRAEAVERQVALGSLDGKSNPEEEKDTLRKLVESRRKEQGLT